MSLKYIYLGLFLCFSTWLNAQHCPFDGLEIGVIRVINADSQVIDGLKIFLIDKEGKAVTTRTYNNGSLELDTFFFHKNPKIAPFMGYIDNEHPFDSKRFRFWFAEDNYRALNSIKDTTHVICIVDPSGRFETKKVPILSLHQYGLCTSASNWDYGPGPDNFFKEYKPLIIQLSENQ